MIADRMSNPRVSILSKEGLLEYVKVASNGLFITAGAGDIDKLIAPLKDIIEAK